ncbi:MAG TPA: FAD-dependent oxidoreductase [Bacteroidales bacterium]|nr:FAD-dependent oxidoreductase [Bacteroidales bacterium]
MKEVVVIGGGAAGMEAAGQLAINGFRVTLLEKEKQRGGHVKNWNQLFPDRRHGNEVIKYLEQRVNNSNIELINNESAKSITKHNKTYKVLTTGGKTIDADAVVVATGFDLFKSERKEEYGYSIYENVITSADLEKKFLAGDLKRNDGIIPGKVGIVHCVGSRDEKSGNLYCSKLCCVTAVKQAIEIKEMLPSSKVFCFYMDMRMGGAHYEELYMHSQEKYGVNYIRGKVSEVSETISGSVVVKVEDTLAGRPMRMELDLLVLMAGMEVSSGTKEIAGMIGLEAGENRFLACRDNHFGSNISNIPGVFLAGTCTAPMNITETISHARAAVAEVIEYLNR